MKCSLKSSENVTNQNLVFVCRHTLQLQISVVCSPLEILTVSHSGPWQNMVLHDERYIHIYWMAYDGTLHTFPDDDGHLWERQSISWLLVRVMWDTHSCILGRLLHKRISMQLVGVLFKVLHGIFHITIYAICFWCICDLFFFMFVIEWNLLEWNWY